mgnify:CR=1 FL=1|jgi:hypothetical protein
MSGKAKGCWARSVCVLQGARGGGEIKMDQHINNEP